MDDSQALSFCTSEMGLHELSKKSEPISPEGSSPGLANLQHMSSLVLGDPVGTQSMTKQEAVGTPPKRGGKRKTDAEQR